MKAGKCWRHDLAISFKSWFQFVTNVTLLSFKKFILEKQMVNENM